MRQHDFVLVAGPDDLLVVSGAGGAADVRNATLKINVFYEIEEKEVTIKVYTNRALSILSRKGKKASDPSATPES